MEKLIPSSKEPPEIRRARIYHPSESSKKISFTGEDFHYLKTVLRVSDGSEIETFDGVGNTSSWKVTDTKSGSVECVQISSETHRRHAPVNLSLAINPLKGGNEETAVRIAAALEIRQLVSVLFSRSEIPFDAEILQKRMEKWRKWSVSEVALTGGAFIPEIGEPVSFAGLPLATGKTILFFENADPESTGISIKAGDDITAVIGPEGGLDDTEVALALERGIQVSTLGPWILRAQYAAALVPVHIYSLCLF